MLRRLVIRFIQDQSGATAIEYGLVAALIAVGAIAAMTNFGNGLVALFGVVEDEAGGAMAGAANSMG